MKKYTTNKNNIYLGAKLFAVLLIFVVVAAYFTGATYAWFANATTPLQNVFTAGTVDVDLDPDGDALVIVKDGCEEYSWVLKNVGTKSSFVRVKVVQSEIVVEGETAWAFGDKTFVDLGLSAKWGWVFDYTIGDGPVEQNLWAGAALNDTSKGEHVGFVFVTEEDIEDIPHLVVQYLLFDKFTMSEAHLYVGRDNPTTVAPGQFPYKATADYTANYNLLNSDNIYRFIIPLSELGNLGEGLKIAAHGVVADITVKEPYMYQPSSIGEGCENNWFWYHDEDDEYGYFYYWNGDLDTLQKVVAGDTLNLCLLMCPLGSDNRSYDFRLEIESVQTTNAAVKEYWPERVWKNLPD
jgi:hypothetical protein